MSLFDGRAVEAALRAMFPRDYDGWSTVDCKAWHADYRVALNAALAALPREELVEKAARALHDADPWIYGQDDDGNDIMKTWEEASMGVREVYNVGARAALVAIGLIPEHVTPEEERFDDGN